MKRDVSLHPPEITRVRSRRQINGYLEKSGFKLEEYYFGLRDLLTQAAIVAQKPLTEAVGAEPRRERQSPHTGTVREAFDAS